MYDCHAETDAHGRRKAIILHRDLKPENGERGAPSPSKTRRLTVFSPAVFLDNENNLKLGDFGLSKAMAQAAMTQTYVGVSSRRFHVSVQQADRSFPQTPYYMSPELINGQPYDVKSDIWALGCLIYELCAGQ